MTRYRITETLTTEYFINANSEEEAMEKLNDWNIDFQGEQEKDYEVEEA